MLSSDAREAIEDLSHDVVLIDHDDLRGLASLTSQFEKVGEWANDESNAHVAEAMSATRALIERIIFEEVEDADASMEIIRRTAQSLQNLARQENGSDTAFPEELLSKAGRVANGKTVSASEIPAGPVEATEPPPTAGEDEDPVELPPPFDPTSGDVELLGDFVIEAMEHLENADVSLLTLESEPKNEEAINAVFRAFHTIKGVAGFMMLDQILELAHEAENLLDKARKNEIEMTGLNIDVTFEAADRLKQLVAALGEALENGTLLEPDDELHVLLTRIRHVAQGLITDSESVVESAPSDKPLGSLLVDSGVATQQAVVNALEQQIIAKEPPKIGDVLVEASAVSRKDVNKALKTQAKSSGDEKLGELLTSMQAATEEDVQAALATQLEPRESPKLGEILVRSGEVQAQDVVKVLRQQKGSAGAAQGVKAREIVKVDAERLDRLVDMIGELVIAQSMATQSVELKASASSTLLRQLDQLDKITRQLQETGMSLRMVPLRSTFQKMARLVRDLGKKSGKKVECIMIGEDTELDKSVVDKIGDPLVHMVRNSVDHGLEPDSAARVAAGKSELGRITLRSFHREGNLMIEIEDDGRGLDREAILAKARANGLVGENDVLTDSEVWKLIFAPGLSTAKKVTDVSGRGVGMDVVRRNIEALRGHVDVRSTLGAGTVISIRLPLTLAIIDGMIVRVGDERYVIPTLSIVQSIQPTKKDLTTVLGRGEMLTIQGKLIPLVRMGHAFNIPNAQNDPTKGLVVVADSNGKEVGILVDNLLGQQQIVIKPLGEYLRGLRGFSGGAIMPDGNVSLIIDVGGFVALADSNGVASALRDSRSAQEVEDSQDTEEGPEPHEEAGTSQENEAT